ncbi:MAG: ATP-binding cassette domain-containing protein [Syntrophomonadaceae bacterium]|jgi:energy-coupling factor transport system ATP-binding protein|nr:energy-coupling factor transporter ATPase [Syntrophomonadaceae bacterium]
MSNIIDIKDLSYVYLPGTPYEQQALKDINMVLNQGELLGLFGGNGSGKSTLAKLLNGLLYPSRGKVRVCGIDTSIKELRNELWKKVGLVFQYPEQQIFEANIYDEVAYGPRNLGLKEAEVKSRVYQALEKVGLLPETLVNLSPVKLSGGVRRRIAIAGVLALEPEILILDEPMAGLDPLGQELMLDIIKKRQEMGTQSTIIISHNLKDIIALADKIAILEKGSLLFYGEVAELLENIDILSRFHLELPDYLQVVYALKARGKRTNRDISNLDEAGLELIQIISSQKGN